MCVQERVFIYALNSVRIVCVGKCTYMYNLVYYKDNNMVNVYNVHDICTCTYYIHLPTVKCTA